MPNCLKCFVIVGTMIFVLGCGNNEATNIPPQDPDAIAAGAQRQQFGVFSFEVPGGWSSVTPDRGKTKAMILLGGTKWQNSKAMIKVDVGPPAFPTAQEMAQNFAKTVGGQVAPETLNFDGETATKATTSSTSLTTPREMIIIYRDGNAYLVMAGAVDGVDLTNAMEHVRSTWTWEG
jgi:hypothetical protein